MFNILFVYLVKLKLFIMKKMLMLSLGMLCFGSGFSQLNKSLSAEQFNVLLQDKEIQKSWNDLQIVKSKEQPKQEDIYALYVKYQNSLVNSNLANDSKIEGILNQEIEAVEKLINKK